MFMIRFKKTGEYYGPPGTGLVHRSEAHLYTAEEVADMVQPHDVDILEAIHAPPIGEVQVVPVLTEDTVTVGDLHSKARGTGARKSAGKPDWSQFPLWVLQDLQNAWSTRDGSPMTHGTAISAMAIWQRGGNTAALEVAGAIVLGLLAKFDGVLVPRELPVRSLVHVIRVLEFGAKKYAKGNWARGMSWSVCYNCTLSHLTKAFAGEERDEESGELHLAHALCNIVFLLGYRDLFPEGDDRLPEFQPGGINTVDKRHD